MSKTKEKMDKMMAQLRHPITTERCPLSLILISITAAIQSLHILHYREHIEGILPLISQSHHTHRIPILALIRRHSCLGCREIWKICHPILISDQKHPASERESYQRSSFVPGSARRCMTSSSRLSCQERV